jgi:hypothetical protein
MFAQIEKQSPNNRFNQNFTTGKPLVAQAMSCGSSIALKERISSGAPLAVLP